MNDNDPELNLQLQLTKLEALRLLCSLEVLNKRLAAQDMRDEAEHAVVVKTIQQLNRLLGRF